MSARSFATPLRYPGGKGKFSKFVKAVFESNELLDGHYVEPYAGGAGVALELLFHEYASYIHINDVDQAVYSFWHSAVNHTEELCERIMEVPVNMDSWYHQKSILDCPDGYTSIEIALAAFFLNRTNRSGILKAGVIGGKSQSGKWKLDARFNKLDLVDRIKLIGRFRNRIYVYNMDAVSFLEERVSALPLNRLVYLDPPYYDKGSELYRNFYTHDDHVLIERTLRNLEGPWIVSYDDVAQIREIYSDYLQDQYSLSYTAQDKKRGSEVMIYGPGVAPPDPIYSLKPNQRSAVKV
ncbi:MAG: DNA adenine methylase [Pseudomonadota bacterium]|jgi:DNA adenine methylase|uniref:DNA adenine methylase n=1 Tax=Salinicola sp. TaxID=1978524 RepID=UPI001DD6CBF8|nr:DNA adenine methylase [Salinicola sp.]MEC8918886.1 DNA adenine methylase [Pseudomonadota bacterium]NRB57727.1 DNA adenine methylase [Salinicola sp.]